MHGLQRRTHRRADGEAVVDHDHIALAGSDPALSSGFRRYQNLGHEMFWKVLANLGRRQRSQVLVHLADNVIVAGGLGDVAGDARRRRGPRNKVELGAGIRVCGSGIIAVVRFQQSHDHVGRMEFRNHVKTGDLRSMHIAIGQWRRNTGSAASCSTCRVAPPNAHSLKRLLP